MSCQTHPLRDREMKAEALIFFRARVEPAQEPGPAELLLPPPVFCQT